VTSYRIQAFRASYPALTDALVPAGVRRLIAKLGASPSRPCSLLLTSTEKSKSIYENLTMTGLDDASFDLSP
jgi:hypothetical protein